MMRFERDQSLGGKKKYWVDERRRDLCKLL